MSVWSCIQVVLYNYVHINTVQLFGTDNHQNAISLAVEGLDPEKIGIEEILVSKEVEFFVEEHIQNPPKSTLGKLFNSKLKFAIKNVHGTL